MTAPVIEHPRDMMYLRRLLRDAEYEIIVLSAVICRVKGPAALYHLPFEQEQMADIVHTAQHIYIEIRLEMRIKERSAVHVQLVLIRVNALALRTVAYRAGALIERVLGEQIVMVAEHDPVAAGHGKGGIGIAGDAEIFAQHLIADAPVPLCICLKKL